MATLSIGQASPLRAVTVLGAERSLLCGFWRPTALGNARVIPWGRQGQLTKKKKRDPMFGRVESQQSWHKEGSCNLGVLSRTKVKAVVGVDRQDLKSFQEALGEVEVDLVTDADLKENGFRSTRRTKSGMIAQSGRTKELRKSTIQSIRQLNAEQGCCEAVMVDDTEGTEIHMGDLGCISSLHAEDGEEWVFTVRQFDGPVPANSIQVKHEGFAEDENPEQYFQENWMMLGVSGSLSLLGLMWYSGPAKAGEIRALNPVYGDVAVFLEVGVQLIYLGALLTLLGVGSFLVVRQVLIKRELETAAKELQDRVRSGEASSLEYFELGAVMLRKKFYSVARKHLNDAIKKWDGSEQDLAQVYNALGYSFYSDGKFELSITQYEKAVKLQPTYVTAWNNLADAYETQKNYVKALEAYEEALRFDPSNKVATAKREEMKKRVKRFQGISKN